MIAESCEGRVHSFLFTLLAVYPAATVLGWSPPNGKAYRAPNVILPRLDDQGRRVGSDRVDAVFLMTDILFLTEIKCRSSESHQDVRKLQRIRETLGLEGVVRSLERQGVKVPAASELALALGAEIVDSEIPDGFVGLQTSGGELSAVYGRALVAEKARLAIDDWLDYLRRNSK